MLDIKREGNLDAVIPYVDDRLHPLHGIYDKRVVDIIIVMLNKGQYKVGSFLDLTRYERVLESTFQSGGIDLSFVHNVNTPEEYERTLLLEKRKEQAGNESKQQ